MAGRHPDQGREKTNGRWVRVRLEGYRGMLDILTEMPVLLALSGLTVLFLVHAWRSERRIAALESENGNLARSIDAIMRSPRREGGSEQLSQAELGRRIREELVSAARTDVVAPNGGAGSGEVEPPSPSLAAEPAPSMEDGARHLELEPEAVAAALSGMIAGDRLDISLQPVVSMSLGQSVGFDIVTRIELPQGRELHLRRVPTGSGLDEVDFDMSMFLVAVDAARRQLGSVSERMRLHLCISAAVLGDDQAISEICSLVDLHPGIARSMVLSLPPEAVRAPVLSRAARTLHDAGLALALEFGGERLVDEPGLPPLDYLKVETDVLMAIAETAPGDAATHLPTCLWAPGCPPLVALSVDSEETAMRLIDLGVDLMVGDWFSPPRRLQRAEPRSPAEPGNGRDSSGFY